MSGLGEDTDSLLHQTLTRFLCSSEPKGPDSSYRDSEEKQLHTSLLASDQGPGPGFASPVAPVNLLSLHWSLRETPRRARRQGTPEPPHCPLVPTPRVPSLCLEMTTVSGFPVSWALISYPCPWRASRTLTSPFPHVSPPASLPPAPCVPLDL